MSRVMSRLAGKVAMVMEGGSGFGIGIVEKFIQEGAQLLILDVNVEGGEKVAAATGSKFLRGDVSQDVDWRNALKTVLAQFGKLDIVVNNAGIIILKVNPCIS